VANAARRCKAVEKLTRLLNRLKVSDVHFDSQMKTLIGEIRHHIAMEADKVFLENPRRPSAYHTVDPEMRIQLRHLFSILRLWWQGIVGTGVRIEKMRR
jgi:hypothetical protein